METNAEVVSLLREVRDLLKSMAPAKVPSSGYWLETDYGIVHWSVIGKILAKLPFGSRTRDDVVAAIRALWFEGGRDALIQESKMTPDEERLAYIFEAESKMSSLSM